MLGYNTPTKWKLHYASGSRKTAKPISCDFMIHLFLAIVFYDQLDAVLEYSIRRKSAKKKFQHHRLLKSFGSDI